MTPPNPSYAETSYDPDRLFAGGLPVVTDEVTLTNLGASGALTRGTVLGKVTANGKYGKSLSAAGDGSQTPRAILAADYDPTAADVTAIIYRTGEFNADTLVIGTAHTAASIKEALADVGIYLKTPVSE